MSKHYKKSKTVKTIKAILDEMEGCFWELKAKLPDKPEKPMRKFHIKPLDPKDKKRAKAVEQYMDYIFAETHPMQEAFMEAILNSRAGYQVCEPDKPDPAPDKPEYAGPKFEPIPPCDTHCTKCGYWLRPADRSCPGCSPVPPLNVRVAKVIGKPWKFPYYPDPYDTDLTAAMGALEEYAEKNCSIYIIRRNRTKDYQIVLFPPQTSSTAGWYDHVDLPTAICLAIVKHSEGIK